MKTIALFAVIACVCGSACGAERVVMEWDFSKASDVVGWVPAEPVDVFRVENGALVTAPGPGNPKMESPLFDIEATPWQFVEIEMKSDTGGTGNVYYSNTTEPPYHGFRDGQFATFEAVGDGQFHTYTVYAFWQRQKKVTHIRVDPPGKNVEIRAIRIVSATTVEPTKASSWIFKDSDQGWSAMKVQAKAAKGGVELSGNRDAVFLSPPLDVISNDTLWATVRLASSSERTVLFKWISDKADGLQSTPILVRGDGAIHSYPIDLSGISGWSGRIMAVGITPTDAGDAESVTLQFVALGNEPMGPPEIRITRFSAEEPFIRVGDKVKLILEARNDGGAPAKQMAGAVTLPTETASETLHTQRVPLLKSGESKRFEWEFVAKREGVQTAVARVNAFGLEGDERMIRLSIHPKLDKSKIKADKSIPAPVPADPGEYLVGAYYPSAGNKGRRIAPYDWMVRSGVRGGKTR